MSIKVSQDRKNIRVLFIVPYPSEGPSNRFRVEQYFTALKENGAIFKIRPFCNREFYFLLQERGHYFMKLGYLLIFSFCRVMDLFRSIGYDITFIHREAFPTKDGIFEWLFRRFGKKVIYDFDDAVFLKKPAKLKAVIRMADHVIAGNEFLRDYAASFNKEVTVLPTPIDTEIYKPAINRRRGGKVVIGWIGTHTTSEYLKGLKNVFKFILDKYKDVEIRIVSGSSGNFLGSGFIYKRWSLGEGVNDLHEFDIGIMPMPDSDWTKGKCAFKIIQYMAVGIPSVASQVGMNNEVITDGLNGFLAATDKEWCERLSALIESPSLREEMGRKGRAMVEKKYSLKVNAPKFLSVLEKVLAKETR